MSAELKKGDDTTIAWFTPKIPISTGPDVFFGLPGLILAVEINGETAFMATSVDLNPPAEGVISKPDKGKKVSLEEFNKIMAEKIKEGSLWIPGSCSKNAFNEAFQERFAPFSHVVNEFKKAQIQREFFLRDPSMGSQPGT